MLQGKLQSCWEGLLISFNELPPLLHRCCQLLQLSTCMTDRGHFACRSKPPTSLWPLMQSLEEGSAMKIYHRPRYNVMCLTHKIKHLCQLPSEAWSIMSTSGAIRQ